MKFKFIGNAGGIFIGSKGTKILCDPWIVDGVFEGSWFHYPPLKTKVSDLLQVDGIYLSHIHPDHFDERYFNFPKNIPIFILDQPPNFLQKVLIKNGYNNLVKIKDDQTIKFNEFLLTLYKPFTKHVFEESLIGNLIDSALVINDENVIAINFNDNTPDINACQKLIGKFKKIDLVMLNYNAAGPYPSCFDNLTKNQKIKEHKRILKRNFDHLCSIIPILKPKAVLPFAGSYIIGGKNYMKNNYLGTTTWDDCAEYLKNNLKFDTNVMCLRELNIFDIKNQSVNEKYEKINIDHMKEYISKIKDRKYDYEFDIIPDIKLLKKDIKQAQTKFEERIKKFDVDIRSNIYINLNGELISIFVSKNKDNKLVCSMDARLLRRILDKKTHWNNAEIGTHITFNRTPNKMDPDAHTSLSFFHL
jgi:UDP-MurNAc hydroxylase